MFKVGDKVVYPMHGAGVIECIEESEVLGERRRYYVVHMPIGDMKVMVPTESVANIGLRDVVDSSIADEVLSRLRTRGDADTSNWNRRYRANLDKIKGGDIFDVADVVRSLTARDEEKGLSTGERKMLENATQILVSELVLAGGLKKEKVFALIHGSIATSFVE
ncbi:CarD family transcriptional regulator [Pasteuria penetrans]|uniref:CarD family transcriptional regulator n=1 Tax=Pasteuria penetrans TaxID=86005 RepID=UPI000FBEC65A|nr:CarD family transcriptional regulator [Pasteuria penetrans]